MNIEAFLISSTAVCVVAQRLLRHVCPACAEPYVPTSIKMSRIGYTGNDLIGAEFRIGRGCKECRFAGYRGRVGIFELLVMNEMVKDAILTKKSSYEIRRISIETSGLVTLLEDGLVKAARWLGSLQEVLRQLPRLGKPRPLHAQQGHLLMQKWNLPEIYCQIALNHHRQEYGFDDIPTTLVRLANLACRKVGAGMQPEPSLVLLTSPEAQFPGIKEIVLAELEITIEDSLGIVH